MEAFPLPSECCARAGNTVYTRYFGAFWLRVPVADTKIFGCWRQRRWQRNGPQQQTQHHHGKEEENEEEKEENDEQENE
jgi:hypothetical protein